MSSGAVIIIAALLLVVFLVIGVPVPFAFSGVTIVLVLVLGYSPDFLIPASYNKVNSLVLLCIPLFMIAGAIIREGKIGDALIQFVQQFIGRLKTGLGMVTVITCAIFGAISGSAAATLSAVGSIMAPKLTDRGYPKGVIAALLASSSVLGLLIPPSAAQILYAWSSGNSVLACFLATITPGIIVIILLCVVQHFQVRNLKSINENPVEKMDMSFGPVVKRTGHAIPALLMPVIILGGIYGGFLTTMEAAAVAAVYCVPVAVWFYKGIKVKGLWPTMVEAGYSTGAVMMMLMSCQILSRLFTTERVPDMLVDLTMSITTNKTVILLMINLVMVILGMLMEGNAIYMIMGPILGMLAVQLGCDPVHFGIMVIFNLTLGLITPPVGLCLFLTQKVAKITTSQMIRSIMPFVIMMIVCLLIITYFPPLVTWLPRLFNLC